MYSSNSDDDSIGVELDLPDILRKHYPNLSLALGGRRGSKKEKTPPIPPATLIVFARDGGIGFVIAPKDAPKNAYGFIQEPLAIFDQIEHAIAEKLVGWKAPARNRR